MNEEQKTKHGLSDFFKDSRGNFDIFSVVNLFAGLALVYTIVKQVNHTYNVQKELLYAIFFMYLISNVGEKLLAAVIERGVWKTPPTPDTIVNADVKTDSVNVGTEVDSVMTESETKPTPEFYTIGKKE
jgi:hypothetical protein